MPKTWTESSMSAAVAAVKAGMSIRKAAEKFSVPKSTLGDRVTGKILEGSKWGKPTILSKSDEEEMLQVAKGRTEMGVGFTKGNFLRFAGVLAKRKGSSFKQSKPSDMWWRSFKQRHSSFSLRTPEATATSRHHAMSRIRIAKYFSALKDVLVSKNLTNQPSRIWNMDETGISLVHRPNRVIAGKGVKTVHGKASGNRELVTVIACGNAAGNVLPPHFIVPGKTRRKIEGYDLDSVQKGSPLHGANFSVSDSGWTKEGIGRLWLTETFIKNIGDERPQVLIFDGHGSHNNLEFIELARQENLILIELPSHTSHWTQPFDRAVFKSLKSHWNSAVNDFLVLTGIPVGHGQFLKVFGKAWESSMTKSNICSGFRATGIYPYNPSAIPNEAYAVTSPHEEQETLAEDHTTSSVELPAPNLPSSTEAGVENQQSITVSVPVNSGAMAIDLPVRVDADGNLNLNFESSDMASDGPAEIECNNNIKSNDKTFATTTIECSDKQALAVIESTLDSRQLALYQKALIEDVEINDSMFYTWRMYRNKLSGGEKLVCSSQKENVVHCIANEICPIPKKQKPKQSSRKADSGFFVISAEEAYTKKKEAHEEKQRKILEKEKRKLDRENKKISKSLGKKVLKISNKKKKREKDEI